jgi:hypothetical protein
MNLYAYFDSNNKSALTLDSVLKHLLDAFSNYPGFKRVEEEKDPFTESEIHYAFCFENEWWFLIDLLHKSDEPEAGAFVDAADIAANANETAQKNIINNAHTVLRMYFKQDPSKAHTNTIIIAAQLVEELGNCAIAVRETQQLW